MAGVFTTIIAPSDAEIAAIALRVGEARKILSMTFTGSTGTQNARTGNSTAIKVPGNAAGFGLVLRVTAKTATLATEGISAGIEALFGSGVCSDFLTTATINGNVTPLPAVNAKYAGMVAGASEIHAPATTGPAASNQGAIFAADTIRLAIYCTGTTFVGTFDGSAELWVVGR